MTFAQHVPQPPEEPSQPVAGPFVYVREAVVWEYKVLERELEAEGWLDEAALNGLGAEGWELAGVLAHGGRASYIFKRMAG